MDDNEERVMLEVLGISYNPLQKGAFAMLLAQVDGPYRIPVVIGAAEAQSIAIRLEGIVTPRPMTHDLFVNFALAYGVEIKEVYIYQFEDGIFSSEITFSDGVREVKMDSRTSDAVALALRTGAPIYTSRAVLEATGTIFEEREAGADDSTDTDAPKAEKQQRPEDMSSDQLRELLSKLIESEDYEEAARISEILRQRDDNE